MKSLFFNFKVLSPGWEMGERKCSFPLLIPVVNYVDVKALNPLRSWHGKSEKPAEGKMSFGNKEETSICLSVLPFIALFSLFPFKREKKTLFFVQKF